MNMRTPRDAIRISCLADTHSGDWLHATPSQKLGLWLQNTDFVRALRFRLGLPICADITCARCGALADPYGDHALSCTKTGYTRRHYDLVHVIRTLLALNGVPVLSEQTLKPYHPQLRVDLVAPIEGILTALDVTIAHPTNRSQDSCLVTKAEHVKISTYREPCKDVGWEFEPLAFSTFGGMGPIFRKALSKILDEVAAKHISSGISSASLWQRVSLGLMKAVTRQFLLGHPTVPTI